MTAPLAGPPALEAARPCTGSAPLPGGDRVGCGASPPRPLRVVVVGGGMVGTRLADELHARAGAAVAVTVLGDEPGAPYNRVLLSDLVAGRVEVTSLALPTTPSAVRVRTGAAVTAVDRPRREVRCADGSRHAYDVLVLATGARARVPDVPGLPGPTADRLPSGVHALRTLADARRIVAATAGAPPVVVLGGGVLGVEVACGLAGRGLPVTVLHAGPHPMDRQLDADAAAALTHGLRRVGVTVRSAARLTAVHHDADGVAGVQLDDGARVPCRLLVLAAGTVPETGLAAAAGLAVGRGVRVGPDLATADPAVHAIGDCAEPPEGGTGLVAQGWTQARRLAAALAARALPRPAGEPEMMAAESVREPVHEPLDEPVDVVRVKADGLVVSAVGVRPSVAPAGARCVHLSDPAAGRHVEVVVHDGVVVGAACVGDAAVAADLTAAYTRRTPVPRDPAQLLLRPVSGSEPVTATSPTLMPDRTTVCRCNGVTKGDVVAGWRAGARSVPEIARATRATTGCGGCTDTVCGLVEWLERADPVQPG